MDEKDLLDLRIVIGDIEFLDDDGVTVINVGIENKGNRDVVLLYQSNEKHKAQLKVFDAHNLEEEVYEMTGLPSKEKRHTGRLRVGAAINIPYLVNIKDLGMYFAEFTIDVDIQKYYDGKEEKPIKQWSDRKYFNVK